MEKKPISYGKKIQIRASKILYHKTEDTKAYVVTKPLPGPKTSTLGLAYATTGEGGVGTLFSICSRCTLV